MKACNLDNTQHIVPLGCQARTLCGIVLEPGTSIFIVSDKRYSTNCKYCKGIVTISELRNLTKK